MVISAHLPLLWLSLVAVATASRRALEIGVYWGQDMTEGSLLDACNTGNYQIVNVALLYSFGSGRTPLLNLGNHCNPTNGGCTKFSKEIRSCQGMGVKVLISIGGGVGPYNLNSTDDAMNVAKYLWNNFLGGQSSSRPLGDAVLDGVDFVNVAAPEHWDTLVKALWKYSEQGKKVYLSASPQCPFPNSSLQPALNTGLFDYVWVQFFNNPPCEYSGRLDGFWSSWNNWSTTNASQVFVELPAGPEAAVSGYIPPDVLKTQVLPKLRRSLKFGGVMLWNRASEKGYSSAINPRVCGSGKGPSVSDMAMFPMAMGDKYSAQGFKTCRGTCAIV